MKKQSVLLAIYFLVCSPSYGQIATIKEIKNTNPITKEVYVFPEFIVENSPAVSKKINDFLRADLLDAEPGTKSKKIFDKVWATRKSPALVAVSDIHYSIIRNSGYLLSITISAEFCNAYCETYTHYFNFNLKTGNNLTADSIINEKGLAMILDSFNLYRADLINEKLREIKRTFNLNTFEPDSSGRMKRKKIADIIRLKEEYSDMERLYTFCLENKIDFNYISGSQFTIGKNNLVFYHGRCSSHRERALDDLGEFHYEIILNDRKEYLTDYGQSVLEE